MQVIVVCAAFEVVCAAFEVVCAAFEVVTMGGFRRGIGTRAKTKLDVGTLQMQLD